MRNTILTLASVFLLTTATHAQIFTGSPFHIWDDGNFYYDTINIASLDSSDLDTNYGLNTVCINITHTWDADLEIYLVSPDGTEVTLSTGNGGDGDNYTNTCFNGTSTTFVVSGNAPFTGNFYPEQPLSNINNGQSGVGYWLLKVRDGYPADEGDVLGWTLIFNDVPALPPSPPEFVSKLPIVLINTAGYEIPDEPKLPAEMQIVNHTVGLNNSTDSATQSFHIGIEIRGSSSAFFPQKPFGFEIWNAANLDTNIAVMNLPAESDWMLVNTYNDKAFIRNVLTYQIARDMGHYASRTVLCELVVNNFYQGVYVLQEKIKTDNNRVDISKLRPEDTLGDQLTGGYIIKIDKTTGAVNDGWWSQYYPCDDSTLSPDPLLFLYHDPSPVQLHATQKNYIRTWMDMVEDEMHAPYFEDDTMGYRKYLDVPSFIDYQIGQELGKNIDGYRLSTFMYKERDSKGGKLFAGPQWDYNLAYGNANYYDGWSPTDFYFQRVCDADNRIPYWWNKLYSDTQYVSELKCRYSKLRKNTLAITYIDSLIEYNYNWLDSSQARHFELWNTMGNWVWPNAYVGATFRQEMDTLKGWFHSRIAWLDGQWLDSACYNYTEPVDTTSFNTIGRVNEGLQIFPNPTSAQNDLNILWNTNNENALLRIYDMYGKLVLEMPTTQSSISIASTQLQQWPSGKYQVELLGEKYVLSLGFVIR